MHNIYISVERYLLILLISFRYCEYVSSRAITTSLSRIEEIEHGRPWIRIKTLEVGFQQLLNCHGKETSKEKESGSRKYFTERFLSGAKWPSVKLVLD
jgi:hypothetical protein